MATSSPREAAAALPPLTSGPHRKRLGLISVVACFGGAPLIGRATRRLGIEGSHGVGRAVVVRRVQSAQ